MSKKNILAFSLLLSLISFVGCQSDSSNYKKAKQYYDEQNYAEAYEMFSQLGDYEDSSIYVHTILDNNAKQIYMVAMRDLSDMEVSGVTIEDEVLKVELSNINAESEIEKNVQQYSLLDTGYFLIYIEDNVVSKVVYGIEDCFGEDYANFDSSNCNVGQYPSY